MGGAVPLLYSDISSFGSFCFSFTAAAYNFIRSPASVPRACLDMSLSILALAQASNVVPMALAKPAAASQHRRTSPNSCCRRCSVNTPPSSLIIFFTVLPSVAPMPSPIVFDNVRFGIVS